MRDDEALTPRLTVIGAVEPVARCPFVQRPSGFIEPCLPLKAVQPPSGHRRR